MSAAPLHARQSHIRALLLLLAVLCVTPAAGREPAHAGRAVAISADLAVLDGRTRITVSLSRAVEATSFVLEAPDRLVVELPDVNVQLPGDSGRRRAGLVSGIRGGLFAAGRSRLVVDLAAPAAVARMEIADGAVAGLKLLVIELVRTDRESFRRAAAGGEGAPETTGSLRAEAASGRRPLIALDAGHGGGDPGATSTSGIPEKDIVLAFAHSLRQRLLASGLVRVLLTRDGDVFVPLDERVRRARAAGADLFVSIHADSISSATVRGATIYTGAERATDLESASLAERENAADEAGGPIPAAAEPGVHDILLDLTRRETRGFSHRVAGLLMGGLGPVTRFTSQPHREAGFRVLRAPDMPSVLVELGYMSNARDADLMLQDGWRTRTSDAMAGAIERFFAARHASRAAVSP